MAFRVVVLGVGRRGVCANWVRFLRAFERSGMAVIGRLLSICFMSDFGSCIINKCIG